MTPAIKIENISKQYRLGLVGTGTLSHDLRRWWHLVRGKEDPYLKIGEVNDRTIKGTSDYIWALRDINFEVQQGEVLGIIGKNGAGKSTLLKILSKVTAPTTGKITYRGRIGSLLEVGTGFHPELTGRENIYLNGSILGMRKKEIDRKFNEIVDFSGCERYIETPVKRYSSGMTVRLGFAVAAFLEPEILVVDEVLAVGDAEFQKKAIGKMQDVSKHDGRTVLFVSHNMTAIENLCNNVCVFHNGTLDYLGDTEKGISIYLNKNKIIFNLSIKEQIEKVDFVEGFKLIDFTIKQGNELINFACNKSIDVVFKYKVETGVLGLRIGFDLIDNSTGTIIFRSFHDDSLETINKTLIGEYISHAIIPENLLKEGSYYLNISIGIHNIKWIIFDQIKAPFNVINLNGVNKLYADYRPGIIVPFIQWETSMV